MKSLFFIIALVLFCPQVQAAISVVDDRGTTVTLSTPAHRIISLAPSLTEMLYAAGGGNALVGAVDYSDYPPAALKVPRIGSNLHLDLERIAALKPDLVLVWMHGNAQREIERLRVLGVPMFFVEPHRITDIPQALERIGQMAGTDIVAKEASRKFLARYEAMHRQYMNRKHVRVFYQVNSQPLMTVNDSQMISDAIRLCGGINVFGRETMLVPQVSTESVVSMNPDVIMTALIGKSGNSISSARIGMTDPALSHWTRFHDMTAVRTGQLWLIPGDQISRQGPRILDGAQAVCSALDAARKAQ